MEYKVKKEMEMRDKVRGVKEMLRLSMDGITAGRLRNLGYKLVFGVTYPRLKELANKIEPDTELAMNLWNLHQRETMILATILVENPTMNDAMILIEDSFNEEIAEYLTRNLLTRLDEPWQLINCDIRGKYSDYIKYALAARLLLDGNDNDSVLPLIEKSDKMAQKMSEREISSVASLLKRSYRTHKSDVEKALVNIRAIDNMKCKWVAEELETYIEFSI